MKENKRGEGSREKGLIKKPLPSAAQTKKKEEERGKKEKAQ